MLKLKSITLLFFFASLSWAQQFHFKQYSLIEGLPRSGVYDIFQDSNGFLWVGTEGGGVCRFDGRKFQSYTRRNGLPSDNVRLIFEDAKGVLWFVTDDGICHLDGNDFVVIEAMGQTLEDNRIRTIAEDQSGRIWLGGDSGLIFLNTDGLDTEFEIGQAFVDSTVRSLLPYGNEMLIGTDSGLYVYSGGKISLHERQADLTDYTILELFEDSKNNIWVGTRTGVNKITKSGVEKWTVADGLIYGRARSIVEDCYSNIWIGTSRGISVFDGESFININAENGLASDRLRCLFVDSFENIWIGTMVGGIMRYNYNDFTGFTVHEGLASNQVQTVAEDEYGDILVGTSGGFSHLEVVDNKLYNYSTIKLSQGFSGNSIRAIYYDENGFTWLGTNNGLVLLRGDERIDMDLKADSSQANVTVTSIYKGSNLFWIGTNKGLFTVLPSQDYSQSVVKNRSETDSLAGTVVSVITGGQKEDIWIGFADGGINLISDDMKNKPQFPAVPAGVENITAISVDSAGHMWIGTNGNGVFYGTYQRQDSKIKLHNLSLNENLSSNYIYSVLMNGKDVWLGHEKGIDILLGAVDSIQNIIHCGIESGFKGLQNYPNASLRDSKGNLWFGTINGLYRLNGRELKDFTKGSVSKTYLQGIVVNGEVINWQESEWCDSTTGIYNLPVNPELPYYKNNIDFEFIALNLIAPEKIKYTWKLEGYDEDWHTPSSHHVVSYTNLSHGDYVLRLRSSNELGIIQDEEVTFAFTIAKPFWHTWWFRILAGLIALFIILLMVRWRTAALRRNQKALEKIISERTAEIKQKSEVLEEKNKEITDSIFYSRRIQRSMLPAKEKVAKLFDNYFIFFRPKDIVSGDFYWAEKSLDRSKTFFAVADCTGHGVPGAMVSLIGTRSLNSAVRESGATETPEILDLVNEMMIESFTDSSQGIIKDGMDIALCALDYTNAPMVRFQFSGAQNSVWIVRPEREDDLVVNDEQLEPNTIHAGYKLFELKPDKQPIGYFEGRKPFTSKQAVLKKGDRIYLYSDGFADQFGGEKGKKFKYKTLKTLVLSIQGTPVRDQYDHVRSSFYDWKREFEQIDDVCFMGVEV